MNISKNFDSEDKKNKLYAFSMTCLVIISLFTIIELYEKENIISIKNENFEASFKTNVNYINRNNIMNNNEEYKINTFSMNKNNHDIDRYNNINQKSVNQFFNYIYQTGFEQNNHNWSSDNGGINTIPAFTFQGSRSYRISPGKTVLNQNFQISYSEDFDFVFYLYGRANIMDGFLSFGFNVSYNDKNIQLDFIIKEDGSNSYPNPIEDGKYKFNLDLYTNNMWIGHVIENVKDILIEIDEDIYFEDILLHNIHFNHSVLHVPNFIAFFDEFSIHGKPYDANTGAWYDNDNDVKTDFQLEIEYEIYIDSSLLDIRTINMQVKFFASLETEIIIIEELIVDVVIVPLYQWTIKEYENYDYYTTGIHRSILYPLPYRNFMGDYLDYTYYVEYGCGGYDYFGNSYYDNSTIYDISDLYLEWKRPISL